MVLKYSRQSHILWFVAVGVVAIILLSRISAWSAHHLRANAYKSAQSRALLYDKRKPVCALLILAVLNLCGWNFQKEEV